MIRCTVKCTNYNATQVIAAQTIEGENYDTVEELADKITKEFAALYEKSYIFRNFSGDGEEVKVVAMQQTRHDRAQVGYGTG